MTCQRARFRSLEGMGSWDGQITYFVQGDKINRDHGTGGDVGTVGNSPARHTLAIRSVRASEKVTCMRKRHHISSFTKRSVW